MVRRETTTFYQGPLPPAHELEAYERAAPGLPARMVAHMEREQAHRHSMESGGLAIVKHAHESRSRAEMFGIGSALTVSLAVVVAGVLVATVAAAPVQGAVIIGASLIGVAATFLRRGQAAPPVSPPPPEQK